MFVARNTAKGKKKCSRPGVRKAAELLEVSPGHLSRVLRGQRISRRLMKRYRALPKS